MSLPVRRLLVLDADDVVPLERVLTHSGVAVDVAQRGEDAIRFAAHERYGGAVVDLRADGANDFLHALCLMPLATRPVVIGLTERGARPMVDADVVSLLMPKPYDLAELAQVIIACLGARHDGDGGAGEQRRSTSPS